MASKRFKWGKIEFPVAVRSSKTSVLKFPSDWEDDMELKNDLYKYNYK